MWYGHRECFLRGIAYHSAFGDPHRSTGVPRARRLATSGGLFNERRPASRLTFREPPKHRPQNFSLTRPGPAGVRGKGAVGTTINTRLGCRCRRNPAIAIWEVADSLITSFY